jgi:2-aminoadipate transaminase
MFVWATLAGGVAPGLDAARLLDRALDHGVAFVPGAAFAVEPTGAHRRSLRLSFATSAPEALEEGVRRLAAALEG